MRPTGDCGKDIFAHAALTAEWATVAKKKLSLVYNMNASPGAFPRTENGVCVRTLPGADATH